MASIETRNFSEDPRISAMLGSAGITALDMELFHSLRERDFSVFLHGSLVQKEGVVGATSDVDFSLVGEYASLPKDLIDTIAPRFSEINQIYPVDYMSSSFFSRGGRKMSLHFNSPDFRRCYASGETGTQVAREYRPARHAKKDPRDYLLPGIDQSGNVRLLNFRCTSRSRTKSMVASTPQGSPGWIPLLIQSTKWPAFRMAAGDLSFWREITTS